MLTLGGVDLPVDMVWRDRLQWQPVGHETTRTVSGSLVTFASGLSKGRPITLEATEDQGWIDFATAEQVVALANVVGANYGLDVDGELFTVQFRHDDSPAVDLRPLVPRNNVDPADYYFGVIKLPEV